MHSVSTYSPKLEVYRIHFGVDYYTGSNVDCDKIQTRFVTERMMKLTGGWWKSLIVDLFDGGFLILMDRAKDMIISGGFNIYPSDLESVLAQQDGVVECAVVGAPSEEWGETPVGFVVLREGTDISAVLAETNAKLGKTQRINRLIAASELPRSVIGKVLKRELRNSL